MADKVQKTCVDPATNQHLMPYVLWTNILQTDSVDRLENWVALASVKAVLDDTLHSLRLIHQKIDISSKKLIVFNT